MERETESDKARKTLTLRDRWRDFRSGGGIVVVAGQNKAGESNWSGP